MEPKVKPIQVIGFAFVVVFFIITLISAPQRTKKLIKGIMAEIKK